MLRTGYSTLRTRLQSHPFASCLGALGAGTSTDEATGRDLAKKRIACFRFQLDAVIVGAVAGSCTQSLSLFRAQC